MRPPEPFDHLFDRQRGSPVWLPKPLGRICGPVRFPRPGRRPYVVGNFATTLDGVVSLNEPGASSGGEITGFDAHDRLWMGVLRALADAVIVGAGTVRAVPRHVWTAEHIYPSMAREFAELRRRLGKSATPRVVVVTASGKLDLDLAVFSSGEVPVLLVTTARGAERLRPARDLPAVRVAIARSSDRILARSVLRTVTAVGPSGFVLVEGGPHLIGDFFAERLLDELHLTLAPQVAGRSDVTPRPGLVAGRTFAPADPRWGTLRGVRRGADHLYLRYAFPRTNRRRRTR